MLKLGFANACDVLLVIDLVSVLCTLGIPMLLRLQFLLKDKYPGIVNS